MSKSLQSVLDKLRAASPAAQSLIEQRMPGFLSLSADEVETAATANIDKLVETLAATVEYQDKQIAELSEQIKVPDTDLSKDLENFASRLKGLSVGTLVLFYDEKCLAPYKKETRLGVCSVLVEYAQSQNDKPSPVWLNVVSNHGALGE